MIKCLIVDDEELASKVIETYLESISDLQLSAVVGSAMEAFNYLSENSVDLMFLDINMPSMTGLDFLRNLKNPPIVILTTAYREYALEGFDLDVLDYLVKPIALPRFLHSIDKVRQQIKPVEDDLMSGEKKHLLLKVDKKIVKVLLEDIYYIESLKDYIRVKTKKGDFTTHQTLTSISDLLPTNNFIRVHRSFTIALDKVDAIVGNSVEINGQFLPLGRNYITEVKEIIMNSGIKGS